MLLLLMQNLLHLHLQAAVCRTEVDGPVRAGIAVMNYRQHDRMSITEGYERSPQRVQESIIRFNAFEKHPHGALATRADAVDEVIRRAHIVLGDRRLPGLEHARRVFGKISFKAPTRQQSGHPSRSLNEHAGTGFAVRRSFGRHNGRQHGSVMK
jgi:hypothetical protein